MSFFQQSAIVYGPVFPPAVRQLNRPLLQQNPPALSVRAG